VRHKREAYLFTLHFDSFVFLLGNQAPDPLLQTLTREREMAHTAVN